MATEYESIVCPLCGESVKLVASATLSLALWQHFNWFHFDIMDFYKSMQRMEPSHVR